MRFRLLLWMLALWVLPVPGAWAQAGAVVGPDLGSRLESSEPLPPDGLRVIVKLRRYAASRSRAALPAAVSASQGRVMGRLPSGSFQIGRRPATDWGFSGLARREAIEALAADPDVERVYLDGRVQAHGFEGRPLIGADLAHSAGFDGTGTVVAVLDTGIDTDHTALTGTIVAEHCFCDDSPGFGQGCCPGGGEESASAEDDEGHGTAVAGIIAANGTSGLIGVARESGIVAVKVLDASGGGNFSDIDDGLRWVRDNAATLGATVLNLSFGSSVEYTNSAAFPCTGSMTADLIEDLTAAGITVVASSGNDGFDQGIGFPACVPDAISVGGVYDAALGNAGWCANSGCTALLCEDKGTKADDFVCHTNSGPLLDVLAPDWKTAAPLVGGGALFFGGTSAAAPYVASQVALLQQADPSLTPAQIRTFLISSGPQIENPDNPGPTFPRSDIAEALTQAIGGPDTDGDGVADDGDGSGTAGDNPCPHGAMLLCDDSCPALANADQADADADGLGDVCDLPCDNGVDDDEDGAIDLADAGCFDANWVAEDPECSDGLDNDGDGRIDFDGSPADPHCGGLAYKNRERKSSSCGLGAELVLLAPLFAWLRRRRRA